MILQLHPKKQKLTTYARIEGVIDSILQSTYLQLKMGVQREADKPLYMLKKHLGTQWNIND